MSMFSVTMKLLRMRYDKSQDKLSFIVLALKKAT